MVTKGNSIQSKFRSLFPRRNIYHVRYVQHQVSRPVKFDSHTLQHPLGSVCLLTLDLERWSHFRRRPLKNGHVSKNNNPQCCVPFFYSETTKSVSFPFSASPRYKWWMFAPRHRDRESRNTFTSSKKHEREKVVEKRKTRLGTTDTLSLLVNKLNLKRELC